jgi:hypothetical protein
MMVRQVKILFSGFAVIVFLFLLNFAEAATFVLEPPVGTFNSGDRFSVEVAIDTEGVAINSAEGVISFNSRYLTVEKISTEVSIFKFWVQEPNFSNAAGTISFGGGLPNPGYIGSNGKIFRIFFRSTGAGESFLRFTSGAILANDGVGTNVFRPARDGIYKIVAPPPTPPSLPTPSPSPAPPKVESEPATVEPKQPPESAGELPIEVEKPIPQQEISFPKVEEPMVSRGGIAVFWENYGNFVIAGLIIFLLALAIFSFTHSFKRNKKIPSKFKSMAPDFLSELERKFNKHVQKLKYDLEWSPAKLLGDIQEMEEEIKGEIKSLRKNKKE